MTTWPAIPHGERLIVVVGPSGAGKDSVLRAWAALRSDAAAVHTARRIVTRPADGGAEQHEAMDLDAFAALRQAGGLATAWQAHGLHYGVRHRELGEPLARGRWVLLNSSRAHLAVLRGQAPALRVVEVTASPALRAHRLAGRGREDATAVAARLQREAPAVQADLTLVNDASLNEVAHGLHHWFLSGAPRRSG